LIILTSAIAKSIPTVLGFGTMLGVLTATMDYTGGRLRGGNDPDVDQYNLKETNRKRFRIPAEQTVAELGEGRGTFSPFHFYCMTTRLTATGIYGPGYEERRKQRLKEKYGIEVADRPF
jgi:hypothetical protein